MLLVSEETYTCPRLMAQTSRNRLRRCATYPLNLDLATLFMIFVAPTRGRGFLSWGHIPHTLLWVLSFVGFHVEDIEMGHPHDIIKGIPSSSQLPEIRLVSTTVARPSGKRTHPKITCDMWHLRVVLPSAEPSVSRDLLPKAPSMATQKRNTWGCLTINHPKMVYLLVLIYNTFTLWENKKTDWG